MNKRHFLLITGIFLSALVSGMGGAYLFNELSSQKENNNQHQEIWPHSGLNEQTNGQFARFGDFEDIDISKINNPFRRASAISRPSVVFIKVQLYSRRDMQGDWGRLWDFFGYRGPRTSTGSGVIISENGYIVTNHHVLENAEEIEVSLHDRRRSYKAEIVGKDPNTDLALIKIDEEDLPAIEFADSDQAFIGDWVLAVGNPFNLESTVTAGILSARSRNLNIVRGQFPLESFLQTDAAINPGNSGGALVDLNGKLIGVNTAILSKTGSYAGYGFAIPSNIVSKIVSDIKEFGNVQRAFIEADIVDIDREIARQFDQSLRKGVYVNNVPSSGNAAEAGLKRGDIIVKANDKEVTNKPFFNEQIAYHRPGEDLTVEVIRDGSRKTLDITLTNRHGTKEIVEDKSIKSDRLGAEFEEVSVVTKRQMDIDHGIRVFNIQQGAMRRVGIPEGFIITHFNRQPYYSPEKLVESLENTSGRFIIEGYRPDGSRATYSFFAR